MSREKIYFAIGVGILCISSSSIFVKSLDLRGVPLLGVACYRMVLAALLLSLPAAGWRAREFASLGRDHIGKLLLAGFFLALHFASWTASLHYIPVGRSVLLVTC